MEKQFVTYEIALLLKKLGFNEPCLAVFAENNSFKISMFGQRFYTIIETSEDFAEDIEINDVLAPLWQQAIDWFANTHKIFIEIRFADKALTVYEFCVYKTFKELVQNIIERIGLGDDRKVYPTYYDAREQAILKAIELIRK